MSLEEIEKAIEELPRDQLEKFRVWYDRFSSEQWDKRIENDLKSGKLDDLAKAALAEHKEFYGSGSGVMQSMIN